MYSCENAESGRAKPSSQQFNLPCARQLMKILSVDQLIWWCNAVLFLAISAGVKELKFMAASRATAFACQNLLVICNQANNGSDLPLFFF